jgi:Protein of unknown function (DUF3995)
MVAGRILFTWLYNNTGKSLFAAIVFHAMANVSFVLFPNYGSGYDPAIGGAIVAITAVIVTFVWGSQTLARYRYAVRDTPPSDAQITGSQSNWAKMEDAHPVEGRTVLTPFESSSWVQGAWSTMTKVEDELTPAAPSSPSRWAVGVTYGAGGWAFLFAALSFYWALGGTAGAETISPAIVQLARAHVPWVMAVLWISAILKVFSGFVALALIQPWGSRVPRWILLLLALSGTIPYSAPAPLLPWYTFLWGPWWLLGGILFLLAAWSSVRRSPQGRVDLVFSALGVLGALVLLVLSNGTIG